MLNNYYKYDQLVGSPQTSYTSYYIVCAIKNGFHNVTGEIYEVAIRENRELREGIDAYQPASDSIRDLRFVSSLINEVVDF